MYKVQLTFTPEETKILSTKAAPLGYSIAKFIKLLIGREILVHVEGRFPDYPMNARLTRLVRQAHIDHAAGKTTRLDDVNDLDRV